MWPDKTAEIKPTFEKVSIKPSDLNKRTLKKFVKAQSSMFKTENKEKEQEPHKTSVQSPESASGSEAAVPSAA